MTELVEKRPGMLAGLRRLHKFPLLIKHLGIKGSIRYILSRLLPWYKTPVPQRAKIDIFAFYEFLQQSPTTAITDTQSIAPNTLNWVIPDFGIGSGGHLNIFRMIMHLEKLGYENRIIIVTPHGHKSGVKARQLIREHFVPIKAAVVLGEENLQPAEFTVATEWRTAYRVRNFAATHHKIYFIQDIEPYFSPHGSDYTFAEATYKFGFTAITAGKWLADTVSSQYGMAAYPFGFSYEKNRYTHQSRAITTPKIFFYARAITPRRGFELGLLTLNLVHQQRPDVEFVLAGWDCFDYVIPFNYLNAGVVALDDLADLYNQCTVALVISFTNASLLPLELMACGCPVVSNDGANVEWLLKDGETALLAEANPQALADALLRVVDDVKLRDHLVARSLSYARSTDWAVEAERVQGYLEKIRQS